MFKLFVDLDGVLADFDRGVKEVTGRFPGEQSAQSMWRRLAGHSGFFEHLEWTTDGRQLWEYVCRLDPTILTGLPRGTWARPQKLAWCARELGPEVPVIACWSARKAEAARSVTARRTTPILVDDRDRYRHRWESENGLFILHTSAAATIEQLQGSLDGRPQQPTR